MGQERQDYERTLLHCVENKIKSKESGEVMKRRKQGPIMHLRPLPG